MATIAKTPAALLSRTDAREVRFAMIKDVRKQDGPQPVLRITLSNGSAFRVGLDQVVLKRGMEDAAARDLRIGDELEAVFAFPDGYTYQTDDGQTATSRAALAVTAIDPAGEAELYSFGVNRTGRFVFAAGVFGKAERS
jgi:hypothetical protein